MEILIKLNLVKYYYKRGKIGCLKFKWTKLYLNMDRRFEKTIPNKKRR